LRYHEHDIAKAQLGTAVRMLLSGQDRLSAIALATAASGILGRLVERAGRQPLVDYARRVHEYHIGFAPERTQCAAVDADLEKRAADAVMCAIHDYIALNGQEEPFVEAFLRYTWVHDDAGAENRGGLENQEIGR
jgi:hypothetical protein